MVQKLSSGKVTKLWSQAEVLFSSHRSALCWTRWRHPSYQSFIPTPELQCLSSGLCRPPSYLSYKALCALWPDLYLCSHPARPPLPLVYYTGLLSVLQAYVFSHVLEVCLAPHLELERQTILRWASYGWVWTSLPKGWWTEVLVPIINNTQLGLWRRVGWRIVPSSVT